MLYCCLSVILTRPKQGVIFHILLFFCENSREGVSKGFFKKHQHRLHCQLSKTPDTSDTIQTGNLWNWNACETDHGVMEKRWMVIPKVWYGSQRATERLWKGGAPAVALVGGCRGQQSPVTGLGTPPAGWPCQGLDRTVCSRATSCGEKPSSTTTKEQEKWSGCPDRLHRQGFPEGLTQTSLQASPFPPSLVETFIPVPWTCCAKVHTISEYTPIYSLLLQRRLTVRGCFPLTPAKCGIEVWGWGAGSLPEWAGRQPDGCPVCLTLLRCHNLHSEVANTVALWVFLFATMIPLLVLLRGCRGQARAARCTPAATSTGHPSAPQAFPSSSVAGDVLLCKRPRCAPLLPGTQALILIFDLQL